METARLHLVFKSKLRKLKEEHEALLKMSPRETEKTQLLDVQISRLRTLIRETESETSPTAQIPAKLIS